MKKNFAFRTFPKDILIKIDVAPAPRMTRSDKWRKRKCVERYFEYRNELKGLTKEFEIENPLSLEFNLKMPDSWSQKKKKEYRGRPHEQRPDLDNLLKGFKDAIFDEDSHIWHYKSVTKFWWDFSYIRIKF